MIKEKIIFIPLKPLKFEQNVRLGCDPEFFFTNNGKVVGSEKVLVDKKDKYGFYDNDKWDETGFIIDGVQAELNPTPETCRALLANEIHFCFKSMYERLKKEGKKIDVDFSPLVNISQKELDSLSEKSKVFGCAPSTNVYKDAKEAKIKVNPKKYLKRSAGGHIHLGADYDNTLTEALKNAKVMVPILDLVVGNTCVLIDRDSGNVERRQNYGRVGEYRIKEYGIEYRTLSNFWLKAYPIMSFVFGLSRMAVHLVHQSKKRNDYVKALLSAVPREDVIKAVQENDFDLAYENFKKIENILVIAGSNINDDDHEENDYYYPISDTTIEQFHHFVKMGIDYWFKEDALQHWIRLPDGHEHGWEAFCRNKVSKDMNRKARQEKNGIVSKHINRGNRKLKAVAVFSKKTNGFII